MKVNVVTLGSVVNENLTKHSSDSGWGHARRDGLTSDGDEKEALMTMRLQKSTGVRTTLWPSVDGRADWKLACGREWRD